mmetsp:Transcript_44806/g.128554  ORF Transcript_44806/g.128554 Transcript_44806/m.128554 type:complete len:99 (-) Transcript_44806:268-564(-)
MDAATAVEESEGSREGGQHGPPQPSGSLFGAKPEAAVATRTGSDAASEDEDDEAAQDELGRASSNGGPSNAKNKGGHSGALPARDMSDAKRKSGRGGS